MDGRRRAFLRLQCPAHVDAGLSGGNSPQRAPGMPAEACTELMWPRTGSTDSLIAARQGALLVLKFASALHAATGPATLAVVCS